MERFDAPPGGRGRLPVGRVASRAGLAAAIDVGSNSVLCLVAAPTPDGGLAVHDDLLATTRLGTGLREGGLLDPAARARTRDAVVEFAARARAAGAAPVVAFATAAVRAAADGAAFARELEAAAGVPVTVLDGEEEARLAYRAAADGAAGPLLVADVGGRSTELVLGEGARVDGTASLPLGALALTETVLGDGSPTPAGLAAVASAADAILGGCPLPARARGARLVASGGTATALAALDLRLARWDRERVHGHRLAAGRLVRLACAAGPDAPIDPGRRRILPAGAAVLEAVGRAAGAREIVVSDRGVRHAFLAAALARAGAP